DLARRHERRRRPPGPERIRHRNHPRRGYGRRSGKGGGCCGITDQQLNGGRLSRRPKRDFEYASFKSEPISLPPRDWIDDISQPADWHARNEAAVRKMRRAYENPEDLSTVLASVGSPEQAIGRIVAYKKAVGKVVAVCLMEGELSIAVLNGETKKFKLDRILQEAKQS